MLDKDDFCGEEDSHFRSSEYVPDIPSTPGTQSINKQRIGPIMYLMTRVMSVWTGTQTKNGWNTVARYPSMELQVLSTVIIRGATKQSVLMEWHTSKRRICGLCLALKMMEDALRSRDASPTREKEGKSQIWRNGGTQRALPMVGVKHAKWQSTQMKTARGVQSWFQSTCDTRAELAEVLWDTFWAAIETKFESKIKETLEQRARGHYNDNSDQGWNDLEYLSTVDCGQETKVCLFAESMLNACDQVNQCKKEEGEVHVKEYLKDWLDDSCTHQCVLGNGGATFTVRGRSIFGQRDSKGDGFWSNHVYVALSAAISLLMLAVCVSRVRYYLRNRRNQQQAANERNPAE